VTSQLFRAFKAKQGYTFTKMLCCCSNAKIILMSSIPSAITLQPSQTKRGIQVAAFLFIFEKRIYYLK
jgi:hypothetical protein